MHYTFLIASSRVGGNSEQLARHAAGQLPGKSQQWVVLRDYPLEPFEDLRHAEGTYPPPRGNARFLLDATLAADNLVLVAPVYWYSVPSPLKLYLDHWSAWMRVDGLDFKEQMSGKTMWLVSASAGPADEAQHMIASLQLSAKYLGMKWGGYVLGNGTQPGDVARDVKAFEVAANLFQPSP